jgi:hypothetical protein
MILSSEIVDEISKIFVLVFSRVNKYRTANLTRLHLTRYSIELWEQSFGAGCSAVKLSPRTDLNKASIRETWQLVKKEMELFSLILLRPCSNFQFMSLLEPLELQFAFRITATQKLYKASESFLSSLKLKRTSSRSLERKICVVQRWLSPEQWLYA